PVLTARAADTKERDDSTAEVFAPRLCCHSLSGSCKILKLFAPPREGFPTSTERPNLAKAPLLRGQGAPRVVSTAVSIASFLDRRRLARRHHPDHFSCSEPPSHSRTPG